ncbi:MAG TPA: YkgJ family cysteine cluster protein [Chitinophagaceae bacterium]
MKANQGDNLLHNWEQRSKAGQKDYERLLKRGDKNDILSRLTELHDEAFSKIDCMSCANCCKHYSPRFKTPDIKRISRVLKMKESDFIERFLRVDEDGDFVVRSTPCPFLEKDNKCGIYEDRPSDCRRFPYTDEDVFLKRRNLTLKNSTFCPITFYVLEKLLK